MKKVSSALRGKEIRDKRQKYKECYLGNISLIPSLPLTIPYSSSNSASSLIGLLVELVLQLLELSDGENGPRMGIGNLLIVGYFWGLCEDFEIFVLMKCKKE